MESRFNPMKLSIFGVCIVVMVSIFFLLSDARLLPEEIVKKPENVANYKSTLLESPLSLPPLESLAPVTLPIETPPCLSSPFPSPFPSNPPPSPHFPMESPPKSPPNNSASPPLYALTPPNGAPRPNYHGPIPPKFVLSPPIYQSPVIYRPPYAPPTPPHRKPQFAVWCVAKPTVPDKIIQEALDYACGSGADCQSIQPNGPCFQPNTLVAHASYAFNSYWQKRKVAGGTCDFGGTAMLVTIDPSFNNCYFVFN